MQARKAPVFTPGRKMKREGKRLSAKADNFIKQVSKKRKLQEIQILKATR